MIDRRNQKHYKIWAPVETHYTQATCEQVACPNFLRGFKTVLDENTAQGREYAGLVRKHRKGLYKEQKTEAGLTEFVFPPGTVCFEAPHKRRLERDSLYIVQNGGQTKRHTSANSWVEDFAEHQQKLVEQHKKR